MRNTCNFCPMVVHSATQISNCDLQDENHGICNRKVMCLYMQKCFLGRKKIFLCHLSRKGMKLVLYGCVTGLLGVFKDFCHTHRICSSSAMNHTEALLPFSSFFFFLPLSDIYYKYNRTTDCSHLFSQKNFCPSTPIFCL